VKRLAETARKHGRPKMATNEKTIETTSYYEIRAQLVRDYVERRGWMDPNQQPTTHHPLPIRMFMADWREQLEAWAHESSYTALSSTDVVIAFRAFAQAVEYVTRMRYEYRLPVSALGDVLGVARNRIEELLERGEAGDG
jgi:hypothetical protein